MIDSAKFNFNNPVISGSKNVLSVFVSNPQYAGTLRMIHFIKKSQRSRKIRFFHLRKIRNDLFVTDPVSLDKAPSEVRLLGTDPEQKSFEKIIPALPNPNKRKITFHY
jgi:hypothetical protein